STLPQRKMIVSVEGLPGLAPFAHCPFDPEQSPDHRDHAPGSRLVLAESVLELPAAVGPTPCLRHSGPPADLVVTGVLVPDQRTSELREHFGRPALHVAGAVLGEPVED